MIKKSLFLLFAYLCIYCIPMPNFEKKQNPLSYAPFSFFQKIEAAEKEKGFHHREPNSFAVFRTDDTTDNPFLNFYIDELSLVFNETPVISNKNNPMMELLRKVTEKDQQSVNHLFLEIKAVVSKESGEIDMKTSPLRWNKIDEKLTFLPEPDKPIVDFASRNYSEGDDFVNQEKIYYLPANKNPSALYDHSEALFFGLLNKTKDIFEDFFSSIPLKKGEKISNALIIYYSSLDSCDRCQSLVHQLSYKWNIFPALSEKTSAFSSPIPLKQFFISCYPCKRSSYKVLEGDNISEIRFDKASQSFLKGSEPFLFIANKEAPDLKENSLHVISYIDSLPRRLP